MQDERRDDREFGEKEIYYVKRWLAAMIIVAVATAQAVETTCMKSCWSILGMRFGMK